MFFILGFFCIISVFSLFHVFSSYEILFTKYTDRANCNFFRIKVYIQQFNSMFYHFIQFSHTTIFQIMAQKAMASNRAVWFSKHIWNLTHYQGWRRQMIKRSLLYTIMRKADDVFLFFYCNECKLSVALLNNIFNDSYL